MSRFDQPSEESASWPRASLRRACTRCGQAVWVGRREPYVLHLWCEDCYAEALRTQTRRQQQGDQT